MEVVDLVETEVIEEELVVTETIVTMETEVDGEVIHKDVTRNQSHDREITQHLYSAEVKQHVLYIEVGNIMQIMNFRLSIMEFYWMRQSYNG